MPVIDDRTRVSIATIVLATDFSPEATQANLFGRSFAQYFCSRVVLLDVVDISLMGAFSNEGLAMQIEAMEKANSESLQEMGQQYTGDGVRASWSLVTGLDPAAEIVRKAEIERADLIVMGTPGRGFFGRIAIGSTAQQVMHLAGCPVLTVGPRAEAPSAMGLSFQSIVFATDLSAEASQSAVLAFSFAQEFGAHIHLCHVLADKKHTRAEARALEEGFSAELRRMIPHAAREWCEPTCTLEHGEAANGVLSLAKRVNADLIVLGAQKQAKWFSELRAGVAYEIAAQAECPVLTLRR